MDILGYLRIWRQRWKVVFAAVLLGIVCAAGVSALTQPQYVASTQLFVTTTGGASVVEAYQGNLFGKERVLSYAQLASGKQVAQRAVDQLQIAMTADQLMSEVTAEPVPDTVLLDISVSNPNPAMAADLANAVALQTTQLVEELETSARGGSPAATATLVDDAQVPVSASVPNWTRNLLVGALAGLLIGLVAAIARDKLDRSVRSSDEAAGAAGAPFIGSIPGPGRGKSQGIPFGADQNATTEAFRVLRTNVLSSDGGRTSGAFVVAGPTSGAGASTLSLGLAAAVAESGRSVVVVDGDLRNRGVSKRIDMDDAAGLGEALTGSARVSELVLDTDVRGLHVLPAGSASDQSTKLLGGDAMVRIIKELASNFDLVLIDGSPLLAFSDSVVLANATDGVLVVAQANSTTTADIAAAAEKVTTAGSQVLGVALTGAR